MMSCAAEAVLQPFQSAPHPGLHGAERLLQVVRQFGVGEAVEKREHDALALLRLQLAQAARQRRRFARGDKLLHRSRRVVLPGIDCDVVLLARDLGARVEYTWVRREENELADRLVNEALDGDARSG